jgi:dolichol-phosphate mannosyltransferase
MSARPEQTLVVIPTYNEAESLPGVVDRVLAALPTIAVLVVDDASPDGTGDIADALAARHPGVSVLHRTAKEGLGPAYIAGFDWGVAHGFEWLVEMDADGSHRPEQLPDLLVQAGPHRLVLGSRWVPGGAIVNWPWHRSVLSRSASMYSRVLLGLPQRDVTAGFRVLPAAAPRELDLAGAESHGYCFQIDVLRRAVAAGYEIVEMPITFVERGLGRSKMDLGIILEAMCRVTLWGLERLDPRPRRTLR